MNKTVSHCQPPKMWRDPAEHFVAAAESLWYRTITGINATIVETTAHFYQRRGILPALMPVTVSSVSSPMGLGSDSLPVRVDLMGDRTFLADSMQFQLEFILRHGLQGAYYIMPTFRGEEADETHLNQFFHSEAEIRGGLGDVMALVEDYLRALTVSLVESPQHSAIADTAGSLEHLETLLRASELPRISFEDSVELLGQSCFEYRHSGIPTITRRGEQALIEHFGGAAWLTHPPHASVPFYQKADDQGRALSADLLLGVGEVAGCGARCTTGSEVRGSLERHLVCESEYRWYVEMKEHYPLETAGFGLGIERYLMWVLQHNDIRDLHVMPRIKGQDTWI